MAEPKYFVGVGGTGISIANKMQKKINSFYGDKSIFSEQVYPVFGLDGEAWKGQMYDRNKYCWTGTFSPGRYIQALKAKKLPMEWYPIPLSGSHLTIGHTGLGQRRAQGILGLIYHLNRPLTGATDRRIGDSLLHAHRTAMGLGNTIVTPGALPTIYLAGSLCGGTGAGALLPLAVYIRKLFQENGFEGVRIIGMGLLPGTQQGKGRSALEYFEGNAFASLWENSFWSHKEKCGKDVYSYHFDIGNPVPMKEARHPAQPFDVLYLVDGASGTGKFLDHFSEYEQLAADFIFELDYVTENPVLINMAMNLGEALGKGTADPIGSGGKSILRYPILKHQEMLNRLIVQDYLETTDGKTDEEVQGIGQVRGEALWEVIKGTMLSQNYGKPYMKMGVNHNMAKPQVLGQKLKNKAEGMESDDYFQVLASINSDWFEYKTAVNEHIKANATGEFQVDWEELRSEIERELTGAGAMPWGAFESLIASLSKNFNSTLDELREKVKKKRKGKKGLELQFADNLEDVEKSYTKFLHRPYRKKSKEALGKTVQALVLSYWQERTHTADIQHLTRLDAKLKETFGVGANILRTALTHSSFSSMESTDIYVKSQVIKEVLGGRSVTDKIFTKIKEDTDDNALTDAHNKVRKVIWEFLSNTLMPHIDSGSDLPHALVNSWGQLLRNQMVAELSGRFLPLLEKTVWEAIKEEAASEGKVGGALSGYINETLHQVSSMASPWLNLGVGTQPSKMFHVIYNQNAWSEFYMKSLNPGAKEAPGLEKRLGSGAAASGGGAGPDAKVDVEDPTKPGNPYEVLFFNMASEFLTTDIPLYSNKWSNSRDKIEKIKGAKFFLDRRYTPEATDLDRENYLQALFFVAEQLGLINHRGGSYTFCSVTLETGVKGRKNNISWFVETEGDRQKEIVRAVNKEWMSIPPEKRRKLFEATLTALEKQKNDKKKGREQRTLYQANAKIVQWALENKVYESNSLDL